MLKQKIPDILIMVLAVVVVGLLSALVVGFNRMTVQAREAGPLPGELVAEAAAPVLEPGFAGGQVELSYQDVFTETNMPDPSERERGKAGEVRIDYPDPTSLAGIESQSTNSGSEFIPSSAFRHDGQDLAYGYRFSAVDGGYIRNNVINDNMCIAAPVYLPHGATFTRFYMYFVDSHPTENLWTAQLWRRKLAHPAGTASEQITNLFGLEDQPINNPFLYVRASTTFVFESGLEDISNQYSYYITYCFAPNTGFNHRIYGFRVDYDLP